MRPASHLCARFTPGFIPPCGLATTWILARTRYTLHRRKLRGSFQIITKRKQSDPSNQTVSFSVYYILYSSIFIPFFISNAIQVNFYSRFFLRLYFTPFFWLYLFLCPLNYFFFCDCGALWFLFIPACKYKYMVSEAYILLFNAMI